MYFIIQIRMNVKMVHQIAQRTPPVLILKVHTGVSVTKGMNPDGKTESYPANVSE